MASRLRFWGLKTVGACAPQLFGVLLTGRHPAVRRGGNLSDWLCRLLARRRKSLAALPLLIALHALNMLFLLR